MYLAKRPQLVQRNVTCARGSGGIWEGSRSMGPEQDGQLSGVPVRSLVMRWSACAGLYVFGRGLRMTPPDGCCFRRGSRSGVSPLNGNHENDQITVAKSATPDPPPRRSTVLSGSTQHTPRALRTLALSLLGALAVGCGPHAAVPPVPMPQAIHADTGRVARLARSLAPVLYVQKDERFPLTRAVAVVHPTRRVIAYHLLWQDDVFGAWIPHTVPTDEEIVWVGFDQTGAPTELWTYWHGTILHTPWSKRQVAIDVQWGKHGSLPHGVLLGDLPRYQTLNSFYAIQTLLVADFW